MTPLSYIPSAAAEHLRKPLNGSRKTLLLLLLLNLDTVNRLLLRPNDSAWIAEHGHENIFAERDVRDDSVVVAHLSIHGSRHDAAVVDTPILSCGRLQQDADICCDAARAHERRKAVAHVTVEQRDVPAVCVRTIDSCIPLLAAAAELRLSQNLPANTERAEHGVAKVIAAHSGNAILVADVVPVRDRVPAQKVVACAGVV